MIDSIASILRSIVMLITLVLVGLLGWNGYKAYKAIEAKFVAIERYFTKIEGVIGEHDGIINRIDKTIRKWKISDRVIVPVDGIPYVVREQCKNADCKCNDAFSLDPCNCDPCKCCPKPTPTPIPIEDTYIESEKGKPTVILYSIEGCGPCEQWWREQAPKWERAGWKVTREHSVTNRPTPYWKVWDGEKWMEFDRTLTLEKYKAAGGK